MRGWMRCRGKAIATKTELNKTIISLCRKEKQFQEDTILVPTVQGLQPTCVPTAVRRAKMGFKTRTLSLFSTYQLDGSIYPPPSIIFAFSCHLACRGVQRENNKNYQQMTNQRRLLQKLYKGVLFLADLQCLEFFIRKIIDTTHNVQPLYRICNIPR